MSKTRLMGLYGTFKTVKCLESFTKEKEIMTKKY